MEECQGNYWQEGGSLKIRRRNPERGIGVRPGLPARLPKDGMTGGTH
jgi:hypothetical protein